MGATWMGRWFIALDMVMAVRQREGDVARVAKGDIGMEPAEGISSRLALSRSRRRRSGMGMSTGQTSLQAPQREEALGRSASSGKREPKRMGERTAPTGPP